MSADRPVEAAREEAIDAIRSGYTFTEPAIDVGVLSVDDEPVPDARIRIPLDRVVRAEVVSVKALGDFGGWGYRVAVGGRLSGVQGFVWQSGPALLVVASDPDDPTSQRREIAAIDDAEAAAGQINALIAR